MGERNIRNPNHMSNLEHDQQLSGTIFNYPQPILTRMVPVPEPVTGFVPHHLSIGNCENPIPYGMTQYNPHQHPPTGNYYNPYMNQGLQFVDVFGGAYKRKGAEGYLGSSASVAGPSSEVRPGPVGGESVLAHNPNHLIQGNYQGQAMIPANGPWLDQRFGANGGNWGWNQAPAIPYIQGNMVPEQYQETVVHRSLTNYQPYPPSVYPQGHPQSLHHQPQPLQGAFYPHAPGPSYGPPRNISIQNNVIPFQVNMEVGPGYVGPVRQPIHGVHHPPHGRALVPGVTMRQHALPFLRILPADEVAILEIPGYREMGNTVDHHRDMRMDVDSMSYEELLALEEHIGYVGTGLSENTISSHLEIRTYNSSTDSLALDDRETDFCTICQTNYENQEKIGRLDCGHEYHVDCVKKWLILKNICPICKSSALTTKRKESKIES